MAKVHFLTWESRAGPKMIGAQLACEAVDDHQRSSVRSVNAINAAINAIGSNDEIDSLNGLFKELDGFLEDPTLLDPHLSTWLPVLAENVSACLRKDATEKMQQVLNVFNQFCKVCGISTIRPYFPHDLETSRLLMSKGPHLIEHSDDWAARTMLLTWSSLAVLVPFRMSSEPLEELVALAISKLALSGKECSAAAIFLSAVIRRSDSQKDILSRIIDGPLSNGVLEMLVNLLKTGTHLEVFRPDLIRVKASLMGDPSACTKKLYLRFLGQLCMVFSEEEGLVEETLGLLMESLGDRDTKLRWTAAKGIARLSAFLDDETISQVFSHLCFLGVSPDMLHGSCLALGQMLSSRKVHLEDRVKTDLVHFLLTALRFEVSKGTYSVGSHVRDSACYTCWAWCKYQRMPGDAVPLLAGRLLALSLFDREIGCRRAGSAAFQELVGRTGAVPKGIELMTLVDFYSIASISRCYGDLFQHASRYYKEALVDHLVKVSCKSFDKNIRNLAASALGSIDLAPHVLDVLFAYANDQLEPNNVHVGLMTISHLLESSLAIDTSVLEGSFEEFAALENSRKPGYQLLAESWITYCLAYIKRIEEKNMDTRVVKILAMVKTCLRSRFTELHSGPCFALLQSLSSRVPVGDPTMTSFYRTVVLPGADKDYDPNAQRGFAAVIGSMPEWLLKDRLGPLTNLLCRLCTTIEPINDVDKRVLVIRAIGHLHGRYPSLLSVDMLEQTFTCLIGQLDDYSVDSRGDVGSYIREASMATLSLLLPILDRSMVALLHAKIIQQALDRLDRVRWTAFDCLNEYQWPIKIGAFSRLEQQRIFEAIKEAGLLSNPLYRAHLLRGWINSAGCPTPSVSDPSWSYLAAEMPIVLEHVLSSDSVDVYWTPEARLCKPLLCLLQRWALSADSGTPLALPIANRVIDRICKQKRCSIHVLIEAFKLLKVLPCQEALQYVELSSKENPYPRIRQICT